jgi:hypothetical protein
MRLTSIRVLLTLVTATSLAACGSPAASSSSSTSGVGGGASSASTGVPSSSSSTGAGASSASSSSSGAGGDALASSFVYVGCNRLQKADWDPVANPSSANTAELTRTFADVVALPDRPGYFFFTGDLVLALDPDATVLAGQLEAWAQLFTGDPSAIAAKVPLVPMVGNHEMLAKVKVGGNKIELSSAPADQVWTSWAAAHGFDTHAGNGPTAAPPNADALADDQSRLTYSFDDGGVHHVVLNTDTLTTTPDAATGSTQVGWIAMSWLGADLAAAQADPAIHHIAVFGHKPIVSPTGGTTSDDVINPAFTAAIEALLDQTGKVRGYFCAHAHQWDAQKLPGQRGVYQVVAGNGGSQVEATWASPVYGFTEVRFYQSGKVGVVSHARPVPASYFGVPTAPALPLTELVIAP